jgi:hypothetical protein
MTASLFDARPASDSSSAAVAALTLICSNFCTRFDPEPSAICLDCLGPLVPEYYATRTLPDSETIDYEVVTDTANRILRSTRVAQ